MWKIRTITFTRFGRFPDCKSTQLGSAGNRLMSKYADYYGTELFQKSWVMTEIESLYSERKGCGGALRRWVEDRFYSCIRPLSNYTDVKNQDWIHWACDSGVAGSVPQRSDETNINQPCLNMHQPISNHTIDHILREGKEIIYSIPDLIVSPTLFLKRKRKPFFIKIRREENSRNEKLNILYLFWFKGNPEGPVRHSLFVPLQI